MEPHLEERMVTAAETAEQDWRSGQPFSAIAALGGVWACIDQLPLYLQASWKQRLAETSWMPAALPLALAESAERIACLERILGVGTKFIYEELVLVITLRVQVGLVHGLAKAHGFVPEEARVGAIDEDIEHIGGATQNRVAMRQAVRSCAKNWGLPIPNRWLEAAC